jgi:hypothetical protein
MAAAVALLGELLDRADFYDALDIITPASVMRASIEARSTPGRR